MWRGSVVVVAVGFALVAFRTGVGVTHRPGLPEASLMTHLYYTLGLFFFGGMDLGMPAGGPALARGMLWIAYFLAPLITVSAVLETAMRVISPQILRHRQARDHVVIVGMGRVGLLFLEALREREPEARVIVLDRDANAPNLEVARDSFGAFTVTGDVRAQATLDSLDLDRARAVAMVTDDDLVNLEVAWRIAEMAPQCTVFAQVADIGMRRLMGDSEESHPRLHVFNAHRVAADRLYTEHLVHLFAATGPKDVVVLAGFGRFGQTIFEHLTQETDREIQRAVVIDRAAERQRRLFDAQVDGTTDFDIVNIEGDIDDPATWDEVEEATAGLDVEPVYVMGTDDDQQNLRAAIALRRRGKTSPVFVRCTYPSAFIKRICDEMDLTVLGVEAMLREALRERIDVWVEQRER